MFQLYKIAFVLTFLVSVFSFGQSAYAVDAPYSQKNVQALVEAQRFEEALSLMSQRDVATQNSYDHRFLKGRILSWKGDHRQAREVLNGLMSDYPGNDDVLLASGNLDYYQKKLSAAEDAFTSILSRNPGRSDVLRALENVRKAKRSRRPHTWRIDGGVGQSSFEESNLGNWDNQYLRAEYAPKDIAYHASANRYNRFGETNIQFEAGIASAKHGSWDWAAKAGFTPNGTLRPKTHFGGRIGRKVKLENGPAVVATVHYRYDKYTTAKIHNISPEVTTYFQNGARLSGRIIGTVHNLEEDKAGWMVSGSYPVSDKWKFNGGLAHAPEAINGVVITTKSIFGGATYEVSNGLDVHITLARDNRDESYIRNTVNVGFTQRF